MGGLTHTVGGTDNLVSFKSAARVPIESLKCHFAPIQEGEGDPSPDNIRSITGWNAVEGFCAGNTLPFNVISRENSAYGVSFTCDLNGVITASGTPTSWSSFNPIVVDVNGDEVVYQRMFGNMTNVTYNAPQLFDATGTRISASFSDAVMSTGVDLKQYPGVKKVRVGIKRLTSNIPMTGSCFIAVTKGAPASLPESIPVTFPLVGKNLFYISADAKFGRMVPDATPGYYTNDSVDTRQYLEIYFDAWDGDTYLGAPVVYTNAQIGRFSRKVTIIPKYANTTHLRIKHNGMRADFVVQVPFTFVVGQTYTFSADILRNDPTTVNGVSFGNIQVELGSEATEYEPATSDNTVYGGYVDFAKGELVAEWYKYIVKGDSSEEWYQNGQWPETKVPKGMVALNNDLGYCSHYPYHPYRNGCVGVMYDERTLTFAKDIGDIEYWKQFCATQYANGTPLYVVFKLKTPIHYPLNKTNLITFLGQNNFWSNTNDVTEVSYAVHDSELTRAARKRILAAAPKIGKIKDEIATFNTDMNAPLKECKIYFEPKQDLHGYDHPWIGGMGKNLFNINATEQNPDDTTAANTTARNFTAGTYCVGTSWSNWLQPQQVLEYSISDGILSIKNINVYGIGYALKVEPEINYAISATSSGGGIHAAFYDASGNFINGLSTNLLNKSFVTPADAAIVVLTFYNKTQGSDAAAATFSNIQFEKGTAVTTWEPYENICPITGTTGFELTYAGKNLLAEEKIIPNMYVRGAVTQTETVVGSMTSASGWSCTDYIKVSPNTVYTIGYKFRSASAAGLAFYTDTVVDSCISGISIEQMRSSPYTFTTPSNCHYLRFTSWGTDEYMSLTRGDTPPSEQIYDSGVIDIQFSENVYGGYVDLNTGEVWSTWACETANDKVWTRHSSGQSVYQFGHSSGDNNYQTESINSHCYFDMVNYADNSYICALNPNGAMYIGLKALNALGLYPVTIESWTAFLENQEAAGTPFQICTPLKTAVLVTTLTPTQLKTLKGINNIWSNANGNIELKYWAH